MAFSESNLLQIIRNNEERDFWIEKFPKKSHKPIINFLKRETRTIFFLPLRLQKILINLSAKVTGY